MKIESGTWVLVLDGTKSLILENVGTTAAPTLQVARKDENDAPDNRGEATTGADHGGETPPEPTAQETHEVEEHRFAEEVAQRLYKAAHRGDFARLVLVAPPKVLGTLRQSLHKEVAARVVAEVHKTLTNHPVAEIARILAQEGT